jgi:serine/threonine protein kinase
VDVWQLGCLTFEIMSGRTPFSSESSSAEETVRNVLLNTPDFPSWLSDDAVDFISQALHKEADKRPSARELLSHPWIQNQLDSEDNDDYFDPIPPVDYSYYDEAEGIEDRESDEGDEGDEWGAKKVLWYDPRTWGTSQEPSQSSDFKRGAQANQSGGFLGTLSSWIKGTSAKGNDSTDSLVKGLDVELQTIEVKPPFMDSNGNIPSPRKEKNVHKGLSSHLDVSSGESNSADSLGPRDSPRLAEVKTTKKAQIVAEECDVENQVQQRMRVESLTGEERGSTQGYNDLFNLPKDVVPPSVPRPDPQVQYPVVSSLPLPSTLSRQSSGANQQGRKQIDISFSPSPAP